MILNKVSLIRLCYYSFNYNYVSGKRLRRIRSKWEENTHGVAIVEIFKELGLDNSDNKRLNYAS